MSNRLSLLRLAFLLLLMAAASASANNLPTTIDHIRGSIVGVGMVAKNGRQLKTTFVGTGFVVGDGSRIITNYHVYRSIEEMMNPDSYVAVFSGRGASATVHGVRLERADMSHDLALLRLKGAQLPAMKLAGDGFLREGEDVAFTGFPIGMVLGLYPVTAAQIKRIREKRFEVYQLDGTAYPGNSGSPVYEIDSGEVIGVINSVFVKGTKEAALEDPSGISYAIPVKYVRQLLSGR